MKITTPSAAGCVAIFLAVALRAAVIVQTPVLHAEIDPQAETPTNATEVTLSASGPGMISETLLEARPGLRVIRDFSAGNPLNHADPTILDTPELDFRFSYSGAVAITANAFLISNNAGFQTSYGGSVSIKGISNSTAPLSLRIDIGEWNGQTGTFTPGTAEAIGFTLTGPFGRLAGDAATITYHDAAGQLLSSQTVSSVSLSNLAAFTAFSGTVSHVIITLTGDGASGIPILGLDDLAFTTLPPGPVPFSEMPAIRICELNPPARSASLGWQSGIGKNYTIERSTNLADWTTVVGRAASQGGFTYRRFFENSGPSDLFFRVTETAPPAAPAQEILLRSSWQAVNIGDIAHTPGMLQLLQNAFPDARLTLWASDTSRGVGDVLRAEFPNLEIVYGNVSNTGVASNPNLQTAWNRADILIHGSGPYLVAESSIEAWRRSTDKPYGIGGVSQGNPGNATKTLINEASFVFLRDPVSLDAVRAAGTTSPVIAFGPDATFALALRNEPTADAYLESVGLDDRPFLCVVPRLRWTPYWEINNTVPTAVEEQRIVENNTWKEPDHAKLREAIIRWVRETGNPVLACPEMTYAVNLIPELLIDPLPEDVKPHVIWRDSYWLTDEAASVYARATAIVSCEMHSPIIAIANGVPAIYVRQPTDTSKGYMWPHVGLGEWFFEIETATGADIADAVMAIHANPAAAKNTVRAASAKLHADQEAMMEAVRAALGTRR